MSVFSCGDGRSGQLGYSVGNTEQKGKEENRNLSKTYIKDPTVIEALRGKSIVSVACGEQHSLVATSLGQVYAFGRNVEGQLGQGHTKPSSVPLKVLGLSHEKVVKVVCGNFHSVALTRSGRVYIWGKVHRQETGSKEEDGERLGRLAGMVGLKKDDFEMVNESIQKYLSGDQDTKELQKSLMETFTKYKEHKQTTPMLVEGSLSMKRMVDISAGYSFTIAVTADGEVHSWGYNDKGQLGLGHRYNQETPKVISKLSGEFVTSIACGQQHTIALTIRGKLFAWGNGVFGQLGNGLATDSLTPEQIDPSFLEQKHPTTFVEEQDEAIQTNRIVKVACGAFHSALLDKFGRVWSFGHGEYAQHGGEQNYSDWNIGTMGKSRGNYHAIPRPLRGVDEPVAHIACGSLHNCLVTTGGECYTFGYGFNGCLGHGNTRDQLIPRKVERLIGQRIASAACAWKHTVFLEEAGVSSFALEFEELVNEKMYSDLVLVAEEKAIFCHKVMINSRCPHLVAEMALNYRYLPDTGDFVLAKDSEYGVDTYCVRTISYPVLLGLVHYLYTDSLKAAPHQIPRLSLLAKRMHLPRLHSLCEYTETLRRIQLFNHSVENQTDIRNSLKIEDSSFSSDLMSAVNGYHLSDISFRTDSKSEIYAHKALLVKRAPYFQKLLEGGFRESQNSCIPLFDIEEAVFLDMLSFIYTGDESIITPENVVDMLAAADAFLLENLKSTCEGIIEESIDEENGCDILQIADRYHAERLKQSALDFLCESRETLLKISRTESFANLRQNDQGLMRQLDFLATKKGLCSPGELIRIR